MTAPWYDDPELAHVWDTPDRNILAELRGHTEAAQARRRAYAARQRDDRGDLVEVDHAAVAAWLDSASRDWDQDVEGAA